MRELSFKDRGEVVEFIRSLHYGRRNMSAEAKSYVRGQHVLSINVQRGGDRRNGAMGKTFPLTIQALAEEEEYKQDRRTLHNDRRFAIALDKVAANCGDQVREKMLSRAIKWTRGDIGRLAKLEAIVQKRIVKKALASGKRPKFAKEGEPKSVLLNFPLGKPEAQAELLERKLGVEGLMALGVAINKKHGQHEVGLQGNGLKRRDGEHDSSERQRSGVVFGNGRG